MTQEKLMCNIIALISIIKSYVQCNFFKNERKSEQAHIPQAPQLLENAVYNKWQFQALMRGNRTENQFHFELHKIILAKFQKEYNLLLKRSNQHFLKNEYLQIMSIITTKFHQILLSGFSADELFWVVSFILVKFLSSKRGITPRKKIEKEFPDQRLISV